MKLDINQQLSSWLSCTRCKLCESRRNVVLGRGVAPAEFLFCGEAPGPSEDLIGTAFVGRAGKLLNEAIQDASKAAGLTNPPSFYITNTISCLPVDHKGGHFREPTKEEALACFERLDLTARIVNPRIVILLGNIAAQFAGPYFPTAKRLRHPAYILRQGGTASTEYRTFVRELTDLFRPERAPELKRRDIFGDRISPQKTPTRAAKPPAKNPRGG